MVRDCWRLAWRLIWEKLVGRVGLFRRCLEERKGVGETKVGESNVIWREIV